MKTFIGSKIINAKPMTLGEYNAYRGWTAPEGEAQNVDGYLVEYTDGGAPNTPDYAGYVSWTPEAQFDGAYVEIPQDTAGLAPHQLRVVAERAALDDKLRKLIKFSTGPVFAALDENERNRLTAQAGAMAMYSFALGERIAAF